MYDLGENIMQLIIMSSGKKVHGYSMQKSSCYSLFLSMQRVFSFTKHVSELVCSLKMYSVS